MVVKNKVSYIIMINWLISSMSSQVKSHHLVIASNNLQDLLKSFLTCCVEFFFGKSNVIHISYFPFPRWNYSNLWIQCKRNCRGPHWSHPVWILFPWINSDQLNVSTAKKNPQIRNIKNGNNALDSDDLILWKFLI